MKITKATKLKGPYWKVLKDVRWEHLRELDVLLRAGGSLAAWREGNRYPRSLLGKIVFSDSGYDTLAILKRVDPDGVPVDLLALETVVLVTAAREALYDK